MNTIFKQFAKQTQTLSKPGLTAKRIIKCVGERLRAYDLGRWEGVPITFQTHWRDESGHTDVSTAIHIHDALEREFGIDIKDRQVLITDIETAFYIVTSHHDPL
ncbi:hypothetical protein PPERSA_03499 [Pseudocohnilembus persalinus]|uniref:Uncharacterized protein n=1 Tax=Pseudocohnilembus persalinus TaxID=266149 RepID=A0A0V0QBZ3_PSEPJ|nr:hypothetical protein PPERSA_03499 [Pseudocohnilembus persalinus]|eukprot:KRW99698.1 hypothetical protein PPERSA_03499 [Pseudocohnilembus persalinus]